ncbi:MAG: tRNA cyclic N6-threonylcarbamoyladenosine(37) synthase TcdA [Firmicutes bacterium]|nr:tRNA cyclic N6-threonylcarbamoyladenosine(37) synthase TcdA [Bacillota bacterium]
MLIGSPAMDKLAASHVMVFGIGGVGSFAVEALVRAGVGHLTLVDDDCICLTNINRQLHATTRTIGRSKVEVMKERVLEINPRANVTSIQKFYLPENAEAFFAAECDYIIDAIDTVTAKIDIIVRAQSKGIRVISCMGAGNKMDPTRFEIADIFKTSVCPLAKVMRYELRAREVKSLKVLYSKEKPLMPQDGPNSGCRANCVCPPGSTRTCTIRHQIPGSISFVPSVAGLILAGEVIKDLIGYQEN